MNIVSLAAKPRDPVQIAQVIPLTGSAARLGQAWRAGVEMAVLETNETGGLGGLDVQVLTYDSTAPALTGGRSSLVRALEGPISAVFAMGSPAVITAALPLVAERKVAMITPGASWPGAAAAWLSLASAPPHRRMDRLARWAHSHAGWRRVGMLGTAADGERPWRAAFQRAAGAIGIEIVADTMLLARGDPGSEVARLLAAAPDAVFVDGAPAACALALGALRRQAPLLPVLGEAVLLAPPTLELAGTAATHLFVHIGEAADAPPLAAFTARYAALFHQQPASDAIEGFIAVRMVRAGLARVAADEAGSLAEALRGLRVTAAEALFDTMWDDTGAPRRASFIAHMRSAGDVAWLTLGTTPG